jgi:diketogulonate reductase-like aldo/keto reductase
MTLTVKAGGAEIPAIGLGTWQLRGDSAIRAVHAALDAGYRHVDTASMYGNESDVGEAIRTHVTPREEMFITTKVGPGNVADGPLQRSAEASLERLGIDRVDLLLIHWPSSTVPFRQQIEALCDAKKRGLARHIGVSNFPPRYLEAAVRYADEPIVTDQVERHPYLDQTALLAACGRLGVSMTSYTPLGKGELLDDPVITDIAEAKGKTPAQVVLRWHIEQPMNIAIPKSADPRRIAENIDIFDFALSPAEMGRIAKLASAQGRMVSAVVPLDWDGAPG